MKKQAALMLLTKWSSLDRRTKKLIYLGIGAFSLLSIAIVGVGLYLVLKVGAYAVEQARVLVPTEPIKVENTVGQLATTTQQLTEQVKQNYSSC